MIKKGLDGFKGSGKVSEGPGKLWKVLGEFRKGWKEGKMSD